MTEKSGGRLAGKVCIVTGGASGIGDATCRIFAREGAKLIIADINTRLGESLTAELRRSGATVDFFHADVSKSADVEAMIGLAQSRHNRLDVLVNNAAIESAKREVDTTEEEWDEIMDVNAKGVFLATRCALPLMKKGGGGSIINISSAYGIIGSPGYAAYHASKGAVRLFTKSTAVAHARDGIRANSIHPGAVDTPLLRKSMNSQPDPAKAEADFIATQPIGRLGRPEEIAYGCLYLASDESKFCIGMELVIDGGMVAH